MLLIMEIDNIPRLSKFGPSHDHLAKKCGVLFLIYLFIYII